MPKKQPKPSAPTRKPRADAERNRVRILEVARELFARDGAEASLDEIARQAGVGPGTLYRHFPTRDALIETVYRCGVEHLVSAEQEFAAKLPPLEALRAWMNLFIDHVAAKLLIIPAMNTVPGGSMRLIGDARSHIHKAFSSALANAIRNGDLRKDTHPEDIMRAFIGVFHTTSMPGWEDSARRLVDILIAGSQPAVKAPRSK